MTEHLHLYLTLMRNPTALFPPMFTNEEPEMNKSENFPNATQTQLRLKAGMQCQVNQESTSTGCQTLDLTPNTAFHCGLPQLSGNNGGMHMF